MNLLRTAASRIAIAAVVMVAGCGSEGSSAAVLPIEPILASDIEIDFDPSATTATLTVDTAIPVACSVVFGVNESFGSIAVDNDMQGGAHNNHGPLLTGLAPETEYSYILQGSDASGTIYRSDVMTFTTPPASDSGLGANIATTGTITEVSSEFSDSFAAENAIDGDLATEWSTAEDGDDAWIEVDLGRDEQVTAVAFRTREMTDGSAVTESFTVTVDGTMLGPFPVGNDPVVLDESITGRILRFDADQTTGGNTGAAEIEIYGSN